MKALQYDRYGEPAEVVALAERPLPEPQEGEVRLRLLRSPIHNHDLATIRGTYGVKPQLPAIGGTELLGVVDALGPGVEGPAAGTRVAAMAPGAWGEYSIASAAAVVPIPAAVPDDAGAQLLAMPLSAVVLLDDLHVEPGEWIVQNAASGAVGRILCTAAQDRGINVINVVRRESAIEEVKRYGAQHAVSTSDPQWAQRVREIAGTAPIARVVDSVCDDTSTVLNALLGKFGQHVIFGALGARALKLDPGALIFGETTVRGFWMSSWMQRATAQERMAAMMRVFELLQAGKLPLPVAAVHPLAEAKAALAQAETPGRTGKVLLSP